MAALRRPGSGMDWDLTGDCHYLLMTPSQMLQRHSAPLEPPPPVPRGTSSKGDYIIRMKSLPANGGHKAKRGMVEPWILEQFDNGACPTCGEHLFHLVNVKEAPDTHFYFCESDKTHRWTLTEDPP